MKLSEPGAFQTLSLLFSSTKREKGDASTLLAFYSKQPQKIGGPQQNGSGWPIVQNRAEISVEGAPKQDEGIVIDSGMLTRLQGASQQTLESIHGQEPDK
jgi:hypothetical protein